MYRILIIAPSWIGDCVMTQPLLRRLHEHHSDAVIDVFAPAWSEPVYARMPEVAQTLANPFGHGAVELKARWQLGKSLHHRYQQAIVLPGSLKSALIPFAAKIPKRTGYVGESRYFLLNDIRKLDKAALPLMVDRYTALADPANTPFSPPNYQPNLAINEQSRAQALAALGLNHECPMVAFCPGAEYGPAKRWPASHFADLAQRYIEEGAQVWLFGSSKDAPIGEEILAQLSPKARAYCRNLCGQTNLSQAIDLLSLAVYVVCNDSGLMHLAAALDRPISAIYGSSSPTHTPPLSPQAKIISLNLECSPCFERVCPLGHTHCLTQLSAQQVYQPLTVK